MLCNPSFILIIVLSPVCGIVLSQIVDQIFVRRDSGQAEVATESKRNVLTFPCGIKPCNAPMQRYKVRKFIQSNSVSLFSL